MSFNAKYVICFIIMGVDYRYYISYKLSSMDFWLDLDEV